MAPERYAFRMLPSRMDAEEKHVVGGVGDAKWMKHRRGFQEFVLVGIAESAHGHTSDNRFGACEKVELRKIVS